MKSSTTPRFWLAYYHLPHGVQAAAKKQYKLWIQNSSHSSLRFKKVGPFWSVRINDNYRSLSMLKNGVYHWFWIGTHSEYDKILKRL